MEATFPFDEDTLVWKVLGKMFCLGNVSAFQKITVKCDTEVSRALQAEYEQITPGYHMNKKLWITVDLEGLTTEFVFSLIDASYELVVEKLTKRDRKLLETL